MNHPGHRLVSGVERERDHRPARGERASGAKEVGIDASWWRWARPLCGGLVLLAVVHQVGTASVVRAVRAIEPGTLAIGAAIAVVTTTCAAWRWQVVSGRLRVDLRLPAAVAACYRAQFLNATLPGGALGDLDRGVRHGLTVDDVGRALRAVAWERTSGQVVLVAVTAAALPVIPLLGWAPPLRPGSGVPLEAVPMLVVVILLVTAGVVIRRVRRRPRDDAGGSRGLRRVAADDVRALASWPALARIAVASVVVVAGHALTFVVASRAVGVQVPLGHLVPVILVVLVVGALPVNLGGWGPREGAAAWGFAAAGLAASDGLAASVAYGTIVLVATAPGALLLLVAARSPGRRPARPSSPPDRPVGQHEAVAPGG